MPAASAEKRARQRANKLLQKESAPPATLSPAKTAEVTPPLPQPATSTPATSTIPETTTPAPWPTPAPASFTISYTPLSISYPEPKNPTAKLPTDAVRVTRADLAIILRQSYIHGSEHGWKINVAFAKERLQADCQKDMDDATAKFAIHEKEIRREEFKRGFETGCKAATQELKATYEEDLKLAAAAIADDAQAHCDKEYINAFALGRTSGIQDEREYQQSLRTSCGIQTEAGPDDPIHVDFSMQTEILSPEIILISPKPEPEHLLPLASNPPLSTSVSNFLSSLFEPFESTVPRILTPPILTITPDPISTLPPFLWSDEPSDAPNLSPPSPLLFLAPVAFSSYPSRDFSDLRSGANPWESLQHRKGRGRRCSTQPKFQRYRKNYQRPSSTPDFHPRHTRSPCTPHSTMPFELPSTLAAPLDWHTDPRLFELSQVLRKLGWVPPLTPIP
ncbi:hypothetical protein CVT25_012534 [Psilocybe cyanescens]|uniref:Uncharacterized protein n=1 Tax=Psilocybe cyanescens TaxID=93625 RepID=A0A409XFT8_PSICY|nr:hypothetical protein CVT25_012534 [Psilocybe cyanescens]